MILCKLCDQHCHHLGDACLYNSQHSSRVLEPGLTADTASPHLRSPPKESIDYVQASVDRTRHHDAPYRLSHSSSLSKLVGSECRRCWVSAHRTRSFHPFIRRPLLSIARLVHRAESSAIPPSVCVTSQTTRALVWVRDKEVGQSFGW